MKPWIIAGLTFLALSCLFVQPAPAACDILIDHACTDLNSIPEAAIDQAKAGLHIAYQHTSHGSQLITGMNALEAYPSFVDRYAWSDNGSSGLDLDDYGIPGCPDLSQGDYIDGNGVTPWVTATRNLLDNPGNSHVNVVVWSWCSINGHNAQRYVDNMEILISEYGNGGSKTGPERPMVQFVFMTGHAEGDGEDLAVNGIHYNNQLIRNHCRQNNRVLFDFADIEAWNPDGDYFWDLAMRDNLTYSGGNWAAEWIADNPGSELERLTTGDGVDGYGGCSGCAHSDSPTEANLNCVLKGRAAWWLWARLAGWQPDLFEPPSGIQTATVSSVSLDSALGGGSIASDGGAPVTARGVCWSDTPGPTVSHSFTQDGSGTGSFTSILTGLSEGTTYHVRAWATNSSGTSYGDEKVFTTFTTDGCPDCTGAVVEISGRTVPQGCECNCPAEVSAVLGPDLTVENGSRMTITSPLTTVSEIHVENGAEFRIRP